MDGLSLEVIMWVFVWTFHFSHSNDREMKVYGFLEESKETMKLGMPIIIGQLCQMLMGITDTIMVGQLGAVELAACGFANGVINIFLVFGFGMSNVLGPLVSKLHGESRPEESGGVLINSLLAFSFVGLALVVLMLCLSFFLEIFKQPTEVVAVSYGFFVLLGVSVFPAMIFQCYKQFIEAKGKSMPPMVMLFGAFLVNIFFNWTFVYGNWGFPKLGIAGSGLATLVTRSVLLMVMIFFVHSSVRYKLELTSFSRNFISKKKIKEIFKIGIPSGMQVLFEILAFVLAAIMVGWTGTNPLAAHQIAITIASLTFMYSLGLSVAGGLRVSSAMGQLEFKKARFIGFVALKIVALSMLFFAVVIVCGKKFFPPLFVNDSAVWPITEKLLIVAALFQLFDGVQAVGVGLLRGLLDVKMPTFITLFSYGFVCLPLAYVLGFNFNYGAVGIWVGLMVGLIISSILLVWRFDVLTRAKI